MEPIRCDNGCSVFTIEQVNLFGEPFYHGYQDYIVISSFEAERPLMRDWKFDRDREKPPKIHRYSRFKRFEWILYQLLGYRGEVPDEIVELCRECDMTRECIWASIQKILKENGLRVYYNRIGTIIYKLNGWKIRFGDKYMFLEGLLEDFRCLKFIQGSRTYFPNLRFVALKMLIRHGAKFDYHVPLLKTKNKIKVLEQVFESLVERGFYQK